jgi:hypothetical protein
MAQLLAGLSIITREPEVGMVNVTTLPNHASTAAVSALTALQQAFAISLIGGQLRLIDRQVIREAQQGSPTAAVHFIKKQDGDLILKRFIETLPIPVAKPADVVNNFWISPHTIEYHRLAFHPIPQTACYTRAIVRLDFPGFARHQIALKCNSMRGVYERQTVYRGIQERSG